MVPDIKNVLIIANLHKAPAEELVEEIREYLEVLGIKVVVFGFRGKPSPPVIGKCDLAFSLGGDGTVLFSSRILTEHEIPILAVNLGNFGFITEVSVDEWKSVFEKYRSGEIELSKRILVRIDIIRKNERIAAFTGLNDIVISSTGISKLVNLEVDIEKVSVGKYRADGIIIATPTGSTAYSAAAGGPILNPEMEALIINPICPLSLASRPIVTPANDSVSIEIMKEQRAEVILTVDGQQVFPLEPEDRIMVTHSGRKVALLRSDRRNFYDVLRAKLKWSGGPND